MMEMGGGGGGPLSLSLQVWPLPEVTASLEPAGGQVQQHGRAARVRGEDGLRPGHQVLLQRPRREGVPHVSSQSRPPPLQHLQVGGKRAFRC